MTLPISSAFLLLTRTLSIVRTRGIVARRTQHTEALLIAADGAMRHWDLSQDRAEGCGRQDIQRMFATGFWS